MEETILKKIHELVNRLKGEGKTILSVKQSIRWMMKKEKEPIKVFFTELPKSIASMSVLIDGTYFIGVSNQFIQNPKGYNSEITTKIAPVLN